MTVEFDAAWSDLHDTTPSGWFVGPPTYIEGRGVWEQYAFDPSEKAKTGVRSREWTALATTEVAVIGELARCLRVIRDGRVPRLVVRRRSQGRDSPLGLSSPPSTPWPTG